MKQTITTLQAIIELLLGRKYYANIINTRGTDRLELSSFIFTNKHDAIKHRNEVNETLSYRAVETVSFRSRRDLTSKR